MVPPVRSVLQAVVKNVQDDWNFKGFGFSFYKSFIFKHSFGMAFRVPLTTNWDTWDRHPEWPSLSANFFYYTPFTLGCSVGASVNVEWLQWCVLQACIALRHVIAMALLILARGLILAGSALAFPVTRQLYTMPTWNLLPSLERTLTGKPAFSTTLQQRVGMSYSWRVSAARGYEVRRSVWHSYLPTLLSLIQHLDQVQQQAQRIIRRNRYAGPAASSSSPSLSPVSLLERTQSTQRAEWWLRRKTGSLGVSTSYPIPDKPFFGCSALLSLSGFYFRPDVLSSTQQQQRQQQQQQQQQSILSQKEREGEEQEAAAITESTLKSGSNDQKESRESNKDLEDPISSVAKKTTANV